VKPVEAKAPPGHRTVRLPVWLVGMISVLVCLSLSVSGVAFYRVAQQSHSTSKVAAEADRIARHRTEELARKFCKLTAALTPASPPPATPRAVLIARLVRELHASLDCPKGGQ
jgi:hypothetical protein